MNKRRFLFLLLLLFFIGGCATWNKTKGYYKDPSEKYSIELPWGWMMHKGKELILTKDGIWLENIIISRHNIKDKLEYTKKKFVKDMLPQEVVEIVIDDLKCNDNVGNLEILENTPTILSGMKGFKLVYTYTTEEGLKEKCIHYGFSYEKWVYKISYSAAQWNYFDKEAGVFEEMVRSFKFF